MPISQNEAREYQASGIKTKNRGYWFVRHFNLTHSQTSFWD